MAKEGTAQHRATLLKIAEAWPQCALDAERWENSDSAGGQTRPDEPVL
jgi:hypothetical protein